MSKESGTTDDPYDLITFDGVNLTGINIHYTSELDNHIECHGCSGKGWIENSKGDIKKCPVCDGIGKLKQKVKLYEKAIEYPLWLQYPYYPWPNRTDDPCFPTYPTVTYCNIKTDSGTDCSKPK